MKSYIEFISEKKIEPYDNEKLSNKMYRFCSVGKKDIIKIVEFQKSKKYYNLAFGDAIFDKDYKIIGYNDEINSNNGDIDKILHTIIFIILDFTNDYKGDIKIQGSNDKRTNVYNYLIKRYFKEFNKNFEIFGYINNTREIFDILKQDNYDMIIIKRKN